MWTKRASRTLQYLTERSGVPKVVRAERPRDNLDPSAVRPSEKILKLMSEEGWDVYSDPELLDFLGTVEIEDRVPEKIQDLIAEVLLFCMEIDEEPDKGDAKAPSAPVDGGSK